MENFINMKFLFLCVVIAFITSCIYESESAEPKPKATCTQFIASQVMKQLRVYNACSRQLKLKTQSEKAAKMSCILKCMMKKQGILNVKGQINKAGVQKFIDEQIPENLKNVFKPKIQSCIDTTAGSLNDSEADCKSYDELIKCVSDTVKEVCKQ